MTDGLDEWLCVNVRGAWHVVSDPSRYGYETRCGQSVAGDQAPIVATRFSTHGMCPGCAAAIGKARAPLQKRGRRL